MTTAAKSPGGTERLALLGGPKTVTAEAPIWPRFLPDDIEAGKRALEKAGEDSTYVSGWFGGEPIEAVERDFAEYIGVEHAVTSNSGTSAIHVALMAAGVKAGDEVIVTPYTYGQTVSPILQCFAIPVFADIEPDTFNLDADAVEARITGRTRAILVVHMFGGPARMDRLMEVANRHGVALIEDCAQAAGTCYHGRRVGSLAHLGAFSVGDGKNLTAGEGGFVTTDDRNLFEQVMLYGQHYARQGNHIETAALRRWIDSYGYTYRMTPLSAVITRSQLPRLDGMNQMRRRNALHLCSQLEEVHGVEPTAIIDGAEHIFHFMPLTYRAEELDGLSRKSFMEALTAEGVGISAYVQEPIYMKPRYQEKEYFFGGNMPWSLADRQISYGTGDCPVTERRCAEEEMNLGSSGWYEDCTELMDQIASAFRKVAGNVEALKAIS